LAASFISAGGGGTTNSNSGTGPFPVNDLVSGPSTNWGFAPFNYRELTIPIARGGIWKMKSVSYGILVGLIILATDMALEYFGLSPPILVQGIVGFGAALIANYIFSHAWQHGDRHTK
jgi:hypothetical protein